MRLAFAPIARTTFDFQLAQSVTNLVRQQLTNRQFELIGLEEMVFDLASAGRLANKIATAEIDLLLVLQSTFADSRMAVKLAEATDAPILLWAFPELPTGGRLRLNSFCGVNLAGHALTLRARKYHYAYAQPEDERVYETIYALSQAGKVKRLLQNARIGVIGGHPEGMDTCHLDAKQLKEKIGVRVKQYSLQSLFKRMENVEPVVIESSLSGLEKQLSNLSEVEREPLTGTIRAYHVLREIGQEDGISGFAVRCWPEFFEQQGCAACGAMSLLNDMLIPSACEADVNGALTQLILQWMSGTSAFGADVVSVDIDEDFVVIWHCGKAPLSMADPAEQAEAGIHSNRMVPLVMEFPLKPGRVTIARLSRATGSLRLVVGGGEILQAPKSFSGTSGVIRFDNPAKMVMDTILGEGLEHHIAITYEDHVPAMLALADLLNLPVLQL